MPVVGSADVRINADGKSFGPQLQGILNSQNAVVRQSGQQAGNEYTRGFGNALSSGMRNAMSSAQREISRGINVDGLYERPLAAEAARASNSVNRELRRGHARAESDASSAGTRTGSAFGRSFNRILSSDLAKSSQAAANAFTKVYASGNAMAGAMGAAAGGISALVSGLVGIVGAAGSAAASLAAIGPALGAILQGGIAASVAFKGVGQAISAGMNQAATATQKSTGASESNKRSIIAAQRAIADARQRVAEVVIANAERMRQADQRVADAVDGVKEAEQELNRAQSELLATQRALTNARKEAREELQQLAFSAEDAALAEERAGLNLEDAYAQLKAVQNLPADNKTRREAELAFKETELNYRQAKDRAADLAAEQAEAAKNGIKGTKAYQSAQKDVARAQEGVVDAQKGVGDAEEKLAEARADRSRVAAQNARDLAKAHQAVARAQQDAALAAKAGGAATTQAAKAVDKYAEALAKLSPSARAFAEYMVNNKDKFNDFKKTVQEPFFAKFTPAFIDFAENVLPTLADRLATTSGIMGDFATQILDMMSIKNLGPIMDQNNKFLQKFTDTSGDGKSAVQDLVTIFFQLYKAISPLANRFADFLVTVLDSKAAFLSSGDGIKSVTGFFDRAGDRMATFFRIFSSIAGTFSTIFKAAEKPIDDFLKFFEDKFAAMNANAKNNTGAITDHFTAVFDNLKPLIDLLGKLGMMFLKMGEAPELGQTFKILQGALPDLQRIMDVAQKAGPSLAKLVVSVVKLIASFADSGSMQVFFDTLTGISDTLNKVFGNETVQKVLAIVGPILAAIKAMSLFKLGIQAVGKILLGGFINTTKMFNLGAKDGKAYSAGFNAGMKSSPIAPPVVGKGPGKAPVLTETPQAAGLAGAAGGAEKAGGKGVGVMGKLGGGLKAVGGTALKLLGVFGLIVTAIQILLPVFQSLYKNNEGFRNAVDGLVKSLSGLFGTIVSALAPVLQTVSEAFTGLMASIAPVVSMLVAKLMPVFVRLVNLLVKTLQPVIEELAPVFMDAFSQIIGAVMELVAAVLPIIMQIVSIFLDTLLPAVMQLIPVFMLVFTAIMGIVRALLPVLAPIITMIVQLLVAVLVPAFQLVAQIVQMAVGIIVEVLKVLLPVLIPIITTIVKILVAILIPSFQLLMTVVQVVFKIILIAIKIAVGSITVLLLGMIGFITKIVLPGIKIIVTVAALMAKGFIAAVKSAFNFFQNVWSLVLKPAIQSVRDAINKVVTTAQDMNTKFQAAVKAAFKYVETAYNTYIKPTLDAMSKLFAKIGEWAKSAKEAVGKQFGGLVDKIKQPIIDAIKWINSNLIDKINTVTDNFGLTIKHIGVPGKAAGGVVEGRGGPTEDNLPHMLSRGEFVMKNASSRKIGYGALKYMNATGKLPPGTGGGTGGFFDPVTNAWSKMTGGAKKLIESGVEKALTAIWDKTIGPWANDKSNNSGYMDRFIGGIIKKLKPKVTSWGADADKEGQAEKKKYDKAQAAAAGGGAPYTGKPGGWTYPLSRRFGITQYPNSGHRPANAVDIGASSGTGVRAASAGKVSTVRNLGGSSYGKYIVISHGGGVSTLYAHLQSFGVKSGQVVKTGQGIGKSDSTGHSSGPHLHFELRPSGSTVAAMRKRGVKLASGGIVEPVSGGVHAIIGEGGRPERVEPLDRQGLSVRDRALIRTIVEQMRGQQTTAGGQATVVRVYIGNQEITDIVRTEINDGQSQLAKALSTGRRGP